jgi:hypothetical protein
MPSDPLGFREARLAEAQFRSMPPLGNPPGQSAQDWETGISSTQPYPAGRVISTKTRPPEPKVFQREILRQAVLNQKTRLCSKCA